MKIMYHKGIFYSSDEREIERLTTPEEKKEKAQALIVPHEEMARASTLLREAFSHVHSPSLIIILSPIHSGRLERDSAYCFFEGEEGKDEAFMKLGAETRECYAEEESAAEILIPYIKRTCPQAHYAVVYTDIRTSGEKKALEAFLRKKATSDTLFIISTNLSGICSTIGEADEWRKRAVHALENEENILDSTNRNRVHICAKGAVDAVNSIVKGKWNFALSGKDETTAHAVLWK